APKSAKPQGPAQAAPIAAPAEPAASKPGGASEAGWEQELESLNLKSGEHEIVGRSASRTATPAASADADLDLTALRGDETGLLQATPGPEAETPEIPGALPPRAAAAVLTEAAPAAVRPIATRPRPGRSAARAASLAPPMGDRRGRSMTSLFAMLGV